MSEVIKGFVRVPATAGYVDIERPDMYESPSENAAFRFIKSPFVSMGRGIRFMNSRIIDTAGEVEDRIKKPFVKKEE